MSTSNPNPAKAPKSKKAKSDEEKKIPEDQAHIDPKDWFPLPNDYGSIETSGLRTTVKPGPNVFDIELK